MQRGACGLIASFSLVESIWPANEYVKDKVGRELHKMMEVCPTLSLATCLLRWTKMERLEKNKYLLTNDAQKSACTLENDCRLACKAAKNPADPTLSQGGGDSESEDGSDEDDENGELVSLSMSSVSCWWPYRISTRHRATASPL